MRGDPKATNLFWIMCEMAHQNVKPRTIWALAKFSYTHDELYQLCIEWDQEEGDQAAEILLKLEEKALEIAKRNHD